jgi:superfamily II DNA or RNA helicase
MSKFNLRKYQHAFVETIADMLTRYRKIVAQLATGGGKTVVFANVCHRYLNKNNPRGIIPGTGKTIIIAVHRVELLKQTRQTCYNAFGIACQPIESGMKHVPMADVYVCMVETLNGILKRGDISKFGNVGLVLIDEAHRLEFMKIHPYFPKQFIIGFTATAQTASKKKPMKDYYDEIVCGIGIRQLIDHNKTHPTEGLCQNITIAPADTVNRLKLKMRGDDFDERQMSDEFSSIKYINNTVKSYEKYCCKNGERPKCIVFNVGIDHSIAVTRAFVDAGFNCKHVDGKMNDRQREEIMKWFDSTPDAILCNVGIATTGFDQPDIEVVIVNRATASMPLWLQMAGRGGRPTPMKHIFRIIDMGGNAITHGDWSQDRDWYELFHNPSKPAKNAVAPIKICPGCDAVIAAAARTCPLCGHAFPVKDIPTEVELHDFVVLTENINVDEIVKAHEQKKEYYSYYQIGVRLADDAKKTVDKMTDERAEFILEKCYEISEQWVRSRNNFMRGKPDYKRKSFNGWHKTSARENLFSELLLRYPDWQSKIYNPVKPVSPNIQPIKPLTELPKIDPLKQFQHYEL